MDVVFVIGLAIEVAGAALLAAGQIRLVDRTIATRGTEVPQSDEPRREAQQVAARFTVGFAMLVAARSRDRGDRARGRHWTRCRARTRDVLAAQPGCQLLGKGASVARPGKS